MLNDRHVKLLEERGLDAEILERFGIASALQRGSDWVGIPYFEGGAQLNTKYRTIAGEKKFSQQEGARQTFWNSDVLTDTSLNSQPLVITEGEIDALSAIQAGFACTVSVPNGAPQEPVGESPSARYAYIENAPKAIHGRREIILAVDNDGPGINLLNDLALRLLRSRCKWVKYPRGCKDLNDALKMFGERGVVETLNRAQWMEVDGLYRMSELPPLPVCEPHKSGFPGMDEHYRLRPGDLVVVTGIPSHGKALSLDTPIPTPNGWSTMAAIDIDDEIFDEAGNPTKVVAVSPVMLGRPCYRVRFNDGEEIVADAEHRWFTSSDKARRSVRSTAAKRGKREHTLPKGTDQRWKHTFPSVVTTSDIASSIWAQGKINHHVVNAKPLQMPVAALPISPYILGCWLGDGTSASAHLTVGDEDAAQMAVAIGAEGQRVTRHQYAARTGTWRLHGLDAPLRACGLLKNKHIPLKYLRASEPQRLALLRGLMDTDGHCAKDGTCEFTTVNERIAEGFYDLACGLGCRVKRMVGRATLNGRDCGLKYRFQFSPPFRAFTIERKASRQRMPNEPYRGRTKYRSIVACEPVSSVPVKCLAVDFASHLFLCGRGMIPTHNTTVVNDIACRMVNRYHWPVVFASFEQIPQRDHRRWLRTWHCAKWERDCDYRELHDADRWINENFLFVVPNEDDPPTLAWLFERLATAVIRHGVRLIIIDPWNELEHDRPKDVSLTEYVGAALRELKRFARKYQVHLIVVAHPMKMKRNDNGKYPFPSLYDISDSAHWYNRCDAGLVVYREEESTTVRVAKSRYHDEIGSPGEASVRYVPERSTFEWMPQ